MTYCKNCGMDVVDGKYCPRCGKKVEGDSVVIKHTSDESHIGKNIGIGLLFYLTISLMSGLGVYLGMVLTSDSSFLSDIISYIILVILLPLCMIIALVLGIIQGKIANNNKKEAFISGLITGLIGSIIYIFIILWFAGMAPAPPGTSTSTNSSDINTFIPFLILFIPSGIIQGLSAFLTVKYVFALKMKIPRHVLKDVIAEVQSYSNDKYTDRLSELKTLRDKELITKEQYEERKKEILKNI